jgi:hypothetical protein
MDLTRPAESVFRVGYVGSVYAVMCGRARETVVEFWSHDLPEVELERALLPLVTGRCVFRWLGMRVYRWTEIPSGTGAGELISASGSLKVRTKATTTPVKAAETIIAGCDA